PPAPSALPTRRSSDLYFVASQLSENDRAGTCRTVGLWVVPVDGSAAATRLTNRERYHLARPNGMIEALPDGVLFTDECRGAVRLDRKSTRLNSSHVKN